MQAFDKKLDYYNDITIKEITGETYGRIECG